MLRNKLVQISYQVFKKCNVYIDQELRFPNSHSRVLSTKGAFKKRNSKGSYRYQCRDYHLTIAELDAKEEKNIKRQNKCLQKVCNSIALLHTESNDNAMFRSTANIYNVKFWIFK